MKKAILKHILALAACFVLIASAACAAGHTPTTEMPKGGPRINTQPQDVSVREKGSCEIVLGADKYSGITWRFYDPETGTSILAGEAEDTFSGLKVSGKNSKKLHLEGIPASMNGWSAYCTLTKGKNHVVSRHATITVTDSVGNPLPEAREFIYDPTVIKEVRITAYGATLQNVDYKGRVQKGKYEDLTFEETAAFAVTASKKTNRWVLNGVCYELGSAVKTIVFTNVTDDLEIEPIPAGSEGDTVIPVETILEDVTGDKLTAASIDARMSFLAASGKADGGWFTEFDFDRPYTNAATGKKEEGGQITLYVQAKVPNGSHINYWKFNDMHVDFDNRVTWFVVHTLNESYTYQPVFGVKATPKPDTSDKEDRIIIITPSYPAIIN